MHSSPFRLLSFAFSPQSPSLHRRRVHHLMVFLVVTILLAAGLASTRATLHDSHKKQDFCSGFPQNILTIGSIDKQLFVIAKDSSVYELKPCDGTNECMNVGPPVPLATLSNGTVWEQIVKAINEKHDVMNNSVILEYGNNATLLILDGNKTIFYLFSSDGIGYPNATLDCKSKDICNGKFVWISNDMPFILSDDRKKMSQFEMVVEDNNTKVSLDLCKESQRNICMTNDSSVTFTIAKCSKNTEVNWTAVEKGLAYQGNFYFFEAKQVRIVAMSSYNASESAKVNSVPYDRFLQCSKEPVPSTSTTLVPTITQPDPATATATDDFTSSSTSSTNMSSSMSSQFTTDQTMSIDNLTTITIDESTSEASNWTLVIVLSLVIVTVLIIILIGVIVYCYFNSTTAKPKCNNSKAKPKEKQDSTKKVHSTLEVKDGGSDVSKVDSFGALRSDILLEEDIAVPSKSDMDSLATSMAVGAPASTKQAKPTVLAKKQSKQTFANSKQTIAGGNEPKHRAISPKTAISHKNRAHEPDSARFAVKNSRSKSGTMPVATTLATQPAMSIRSSD